MVEINTDKISMAPWTCTEADEGIMHKLKSSIRKFGQARNITVVHHKSIDVYECIEGRKILNTLRSLGLRTAWCNVLTDVESSFSKSLNITLNFLQPEIEYIGCSELIKEISKDQPLHHINLHLPWSAEELKKIKQLADFDWSQYDDVVSPNQQDLFGA